MSTQLPSPLLEFMNAVFEQLDFLIQVASGLELQGSILSSITHPR